MPNKTRLLLFEDNADMREGIAWVLRSDPNFDLLDTFGEANDIANILAAHTPDVILMDIQMPGISGIDALEIIKAIRPDIHTVMLTSFDDEDNIFNAIRSGASGYLLKTNISTGIVNAVKEVMDGGSPMNARVARKVMNFFKETKTITPDYHLTAREKEILTHLVNGDTPKAIAKLLFISPQTVGNHIRHIYEKLEVHTRTEAITKVFREKLL